MIKFHEKLLCGCIAWRCFNDKELSLELPEMNFCDMNGAIEIARKVSPAVERIVVFVGGKKDIEYRLSNDHWEAVCF